MTGEQQQTKKTTLGNNSDPLDTTFNGTTISSKVVGNVSKVGNNITVAAKSIKHRWLKEQHHFAYHGSPHNFKEFNLSKVGTGEGVQGFGWGQYFSGTQDVGEKYRMTLSASQRIIYKGTDITNDKNQATAAKYLIKKQGDKETAILALREAAEKRPHMQAALHELIKMDVSDIHIKNTQGQLYQVTIPEEAIDCMLNWDKLLTEQDTHVKKALIQLAREFNERDSLKDHLEHINLRFNELAGKDVYKLAENALLAGTLKLPENSKTIISGKKATSEYLASLGIPGLLYFDKRSREKGEGTHNYVVWDQKLIDRINKGQIEEFYL